MGKEKIEKGQWWYLKSHGAQCVTKVRIEDVSDKTVVVVNERDIDFSMEGSRYKISDLEFIEKIKK